jgi:hypothetical protein
MPEREKGDEDEGLAKGLGDGGRQHEDRLQHGDGTRIDVDAHAGLVV